MDPHGDAVRDMIKDWGAAFRKARGKEATKVAMPWSKLEARERHAEMDSKPDGQERRLREKTIAEKETREMQEEMIPMHRRGKRRNQREMQMRKRESGV
ncbi:hypothetical protein HOY80DRAFT_1030011 [Tuber brumale]|nr:hypothetical protein HOY80DRAFT_1030011 [Tuber brumale]